VGNLIEPRDYSTSIEGVLVRFLTRAPNEIPAYMDAGVAALKKALLRVRINVYDPTTIELLSCLQNVHDVFGVWEWQERLNAIARQFGLRGPASCGIGNARRSASMSALDLGVDISGFSPNAIAGKPGTGKTGLAHQIMYALVNRDPKALLAMGHNDH
jgi:Cdc6-like AAA superfamily ATPase